MKRIPQAKWKKPVLIGGVGVLGVLLIGALIWMAVSGPSTSPGSGSPNFADLPPDTEPSDTMSPSESGEGYGFSNEMLYTPFEKPEPPQPLKAVSLDGYNSSWKIQLDVQNRPAGDVLKELIDECGLKLETPPAVATSRGKPITLKLDNVSRLEAIEQVCRQAGIHMQVSEWRPDAISLQPGPRPWPVTFAGPFLISVADLNEHVPHATGTLRIEVLATGLPPSLASRWKETSTQLVELTQIEDAAGQRLLDEIQTAGFSDLRPPSAYRQILDISLKNLLRNVDAIKILQGKIRLSIPTQVEVLTFDRLEQGQTQAIGDVRFTIDRASLGGQSQIDFEIEGANQQDIEILAYNAKGERVERMGFSWSQMGGETSADLWFNGQPQSIEVRAIVKSEDVEYAFALPEIALKSHEQMPGALEPVQFDGPEPVTGKFVKFAGDENFRKVVFALTNHANKDIRTLELKLFYLDAGGKTLKESPHSQPLGQSPLKQNSTTELELSAFFMPEGTKSVSARTERVTFFDASVWDRADVFTDEDIPYVMGTVALSLTHADDLSAGYVGLDTGGKVVSNMAGVLDISVASSRKWTSSLTHKPRVTSIRLQDGTAAKFSHVQLIPGQYLFYIRRGERNGAWKWITVDDQTKQDIAFTIDDEQTGTLEVLVPDTTSAPQVDLIPLDEAGTVPIAESDLAKLRIGYWLGTSLQPESGKAVFEGLSVGKYRVLAGALSRDVEILAGKNTSISLP